MTKIQWFFLWLLFVGYLFMGAGVFYVIEHTLEEEERQNLHQERNEIHDLLEYHFAKDSVYVRNLIESRLTDYCGKPLTRAAENDSSPYHWSFYNSFFFALTTLSTVGYGNLSPSTDNGRLLMILYALIGIPFMGIVVSQLGEFFGSVFLRAHWRYKNRVYESCTPLVLDIVLYLVPGLLIIIIVPAVMFAHFEQWTLVTGIYYAFVTLTTIGFGDFVAGQRDEPSVLYQVYKVILVIWVMFGLGYLVMVMGFISRGLRNKRLHKLEHRLAHTIKQTRSKIWNEFRSEVTTVRRMLNEMYLLKVKPVYRDKLKPREFGRSNSCPQFATWPVPKSQENDDDDDDDDRSWPKGPRRRAYSEFVANDEGQLHRVMSESRLNDVDMDATFETLVRSSSVATVESKQLLARVAALTATQRQGVDGFSDEEILSSENFPYYRQTNRSRAHSVAIPYLSDPPSPQQHTWAGDQHLSFAETIRNVKGVRSAEQLPPASSGSNSSLRRMSIAAINFFSTPLANKLRKKSSKDLTSTKTPDIIQKSSESIPEERRLSEDAIIERAYQTYCGERRPSIIDAISALKPKHLGDGGKMGPVMERTSVADLIRLLSSVEELQEECAAPPSLARLFDRRPSFAEENATKNLGEQPKVERRQSLFSPSFTRLFDRRSSVADENNLTEQSRNERRRSLFSPSLTSLFERRPSSENIRDKSSERHENGNLSESRNERPSTQEPQERRSSVAISFSRLFDRRPSLAPSDGSRGSSLVPSLTRLFERRSSTSQGASLESGENHKSTKVQSLAKLFDRPPDDSHVPPSLLQGSRPPGRQVRVVPPALVVTSPDGSHRFSVHSPSEDELVDVVTRP